MDISDHLNRVSAIREVARDSQVMDARYALSIPEGAYPLVIKQFPGIRSGDRMERWKAWKAFSETPVGQAFKVKGGF